MHWTIDHATGTYHSIFPTPTGNPADPTLTAHGVRQSQELADYFVSEKFPGPRPWRIYSSPFYRCLQTIRPSVEALDGGDYAGGNNAGRGEKGVRIENGLGFVFYAPVRQKVIKLLTIDVENGSAHRHTSITHHPPQYLSCMNISPPSYRTLPPVPNTTSTLSPHHAARQYHNFTTV